jgi:hypothetical protein
LVATAQPAATSATAPLFGNARTQRARSSTVRHAQATRPVTSTTPTASTTHRATASRTTGSDTGQPSTPGTGSEQAAIRTCYPPVHIPAVHLPGTHIPAQTIPATTVGGQTLPATHLPATTLPPVDLPETTLPGGCLEVPKAFALASTTVRVSDYAALDPGYSQPLTARYWAAAPSATSTPDPTAPGFGQFNAAGFPKNQYVRPYIRRDGTGVSGYWRNSPSDGLPTCKVITC